MLTQRRWVTAAMAASVLLTACGGASGTEPPREVRQDVRQEGADEADQPPDQQTPETGPEGEVAGPDSQAETADPSTGESPTSESPAAESSESATQDDNPWAGTGSPDGAFLMPSGNVACAMGQEWTACQILERDYVPRQAFAGCAPFQADTILLRSGQEPVWICSEHSMFAVANELGAATLDYGTQYARGEFTCLSDSAGVQCRNASDHSFRLARGSYDLV